MSNAPLPQRAPRHLSALDGIRAFAVIAVILYHAGVRWVNGGLLGVDVFFVLSGFLITSLLCDEFAEKMTVRLRSFWARRARRLLPGLVLLLLGVALYCYILGNDVDVASIRLDAISTLLYVANWHFIFSSQGYFALSMSPSPLLHMWSLGVEEQYYLIWPIVSLFVLRRFGARGLAWVALIGTLCSALLMGLMHVAGYTVNRLYYGTDTRCQALLLGSFLGAWGARKGWRIIDEGWANSTKGRAFGLLLSVLGVGALGWFFYDVNGHTPLLYDGGFLLVAASTGLVIMAVTNWPRSPLTSILSLKPLTYIGRISYGLYLYHWPLFLALDGGHTGLHGSALLTVRLAATLIAAMLSYHLVEMPIRTGSISRTLKGLFLALGAAGATAAIVIVATITPAGANLGLKLIPKSSEPAAQQHELAKAHAYTTDPIRFLLLGDSVALTAGKGLSHEAISRYGVAVLDNGVLGCDLDDLTTRIGGIIYPPDPTVNCGSWRKDFAQDLVRQHPEVVGLIIGRFELCTHLWHGQWVHVGTAHWDRHLKTDYVQAIKLLSSHGAHVELFTFPFIDPPNEEPNGTPWPENVPSRVVALNKIITSAAHTEGKLVSLVNLNAMLDPGGHYDQYINGIDVRYNTDGIHVSIAGGEYIQGKILPLVAAKGLAVRRTKHI